MIPHNRQIDLPTGDTIGSASSWCISFVQDMCSLELSHRRPHSAAHQGGKHGSESEGHEEESAGGVTGAEARRVELYLLSTCLSTLEKAASGPC